MFNKLGTCLYSQLCFLLLVILQWENMLIVSTERPSTTTSPLDKYTKKYCTDLQNIIKAKQKSCFLRPETGPCRADVIQYYFDVKASECFRFFYGGCQGNGNRFETKQECYDKCHLDDSNLKGRIPNFCSESFDYGTCFGYYNRWTYDKVSMSCRRRLYSGCGGNQNNFETRAECLATCLQTPGSTLTKYRSMSLTTCIPYAVPISLQ